MSDVAAPEERVGPFAPLRHGLFRRIWTASVVSNFGQLIQGVGAAWAMTQITGRADMVALVQSATFAPMMMLSLVAGAVADSYDRRKVAMTALSLALIGATTISLITLAGFLNPAWILVSCFVVGTGMALFGPAWQSSVGDSESAFTPSADHTCGDSGTALAARGQTPPPSDICERS